MTLTEFENEFKPFIAEQRVYCITYECETPNSLGDDAADQIAIIDRQNDVVNLVKGARINFSCIQCSAVQLIDADPLVALYLKRAG